MVIKYVPYVVLILSATFSGCFSDDSKNKSSSVEYKNSTGEAGTPYPKKVNITGVRLDPEDKEELSNFIREQFYHIAGLAEFAGFFTNVNSDSKNTMQITSVQVHISSMFDIDGNIGAEVVFDPKDVEENKEVATTTNDAPEDVSYDAYKVDGTGVKIGADLNLLRMTVRPVGVFIGNDGTQKIPLRFNPTTHIMGVQGNAGAGGGLSFDASKVITMIQGAVLLKTGNIKAVKALEVLKPFLDGQAKFGAHIGVNHGLSLPVSGIYWLDGFDSEYKKKAKEKGFFATPFTEHLFSSVAVRMCETFRNPKLDVNAAVEDNNNPRPPVCQPNFLNLAIDYARTSFPQVNSSTPHLLALGGCSKTSDGYFVKMTVPKEFHKEIHNGAIVINFTAVNSVDGKIINISPTTKINRHAKSQPALFEHALETAGCPKKQDIAILSGSLEFAADPDNREYVCMDYPVHTENKVGLGSAIRCSDDPHNPLLELSNRWLIARFGDNHWKPVRASMYNLGTLSKNRSYDQRFDTLKLQESEEVSLKQLGYKAAFDPIGNPSTQFPEDLSQVKIGIEKE